MSFMATGRITHIGMVESGTSQRSGYEWKRQVFVVELDCKEHWKIPFELMGQRVDNTILEQDAEVDVFFDIDGREYNGRWYSQNRAFLVRPHQEATQQQRFDDMVAMAAHGMKA